MIHLPVLLNPDFTEVRRLSPVSLNLKLNMTPLSTASMTLSEGEEIPSRSFVEIFTAKGSAGVFRAREPETSYGETQTSIELEHAITEVGDSLITESIEEELPLDEAMQMLFSYYKGEAWQMGEINFTDTVVVDVDYVNVLEAIISVLQQVPSYYMTFDFSTSPWTFGLTQVDSQVSAEGRLSRNVSSGSFKNDDSSLATRAYAIYKDGDEEILIHEDSSWGQEHFGLVERKLSDTYESEAKARAAAQKYLEQNNRPRFSISINGTELSDMTGETLDEFEIGRRFRFVFDPVVEPVDEIIKSVEYTDLVADEHNVIVSMNEEEELDYVLDGIKQNEKNNRRTTKNLKKLNDEIHLELYSEDGYFNSRLDFTASHLRTEFMDNLNSMHGELEMTASHLRTEFTDGINDLHSEFEVSASHLRTEFTDGINSLHSEFEVSASHLRTEFTDGINSLHSEFEVSASHLRTEFTDGINSLHSEFEVSASHLRTEFTDGQNSLRSEFEITASHMRTEFSNSINSMRTVVEQTDSGWRTALEGVVDANGNVTAASIATKINAQGQAGVKISGSWIDIDGIVSQLASEQVTVDAMTCNGTILANAIDVQHIYLDGEFEYNIYDAEVNGNTLTLYRVTGDPITFSKATSLSGSWSGRNYTVTAKQNNVSVGTKTGIVYDGLVPTGSVTQSGKTVYRDFIVYSDDGEGEADQIIMQKNIGIDATSVYNYGKSDVTLNDPTWNAISGAMPSSRTVTVTTSGRTNSSGTTDNLSKSVSLYLVKSGLTVYMRAGSTSGTTYAQTTCSDSNLSAGNIKSGVSIFGVTGSYAGAITSVTAGTSAISWDSTNKKFYNYGYAYTNGSSQPAATSTKRESSALSIGDDSWSNGTKKVWVKHGSSEILSDTVSLPAVSDTYWENTTGDTWRTRITIGGAYRYSSTKTFTPNYYNADSFDTTAAETSVQVNGHYNNSDGYYISSNSRNADVQINVKGTWTHGGGSETHYSWIEGAAGRLYRRGYDNGASGGASHAITSFDTTAASNSETYNNLTNNSDGYVISGTGPNANAYIVTKSTWKCDGQDKSALSYLASAPKSLYHEAFMRGWANYYDDPDWWEAPSSSNGNKCYIPNRSRTGKTLWFTVSSSGSNYTSLGSGWYYTVTALSNGKYKHSFVLEMASNSYKGLSNGTNYTLYK